MKASIVAVMAIVFAPPDAPATAQDPEDPARQEKKICRTEKMTGSLTGAPASA